MLDQQQSFRRCARIALALPALWVLAACGSYHTPNPAPDPERVEAIRAEQERRTLEHERAVAARAEMERIGLAIESGTGLLSEADFEGVFEYRCGECHFWPVDQLGSQWPRDLATMIEEGKISPGDGEGSRLVQRMREGSMPPISSGEPAVPTATIDRIVDFIDSLDPAPSDG